MRLRVALASAAVLAASGLTGAPALAATCDVNGCFAQIQAAAGVVVNDIFHDVNNLTADKLPVYGKLINNWPGCTEHVDYAGAGHSIAPYDCPGLYVGDATTPTVANANTFLGSVDRKWWQPCRLNNPAVVNNCVQDWSCIADGTGGNYNPWQGLVFDLGGPSNKVVIVAENDHGPQPCESLEYTVFLSDNPFSQAQVLDPASQGVDPTKWNRAVLSKIYTGGWVQVRPPNPVMYAATCGDSAQFSVEEDSFVQVFSLPCGITFRYAAVVAGNDGRDFPACAYDSNEAEVDAVAGLTESGAAVCPDNDHDGYVDCSCPGAPMPPGCDCNDGDPKIHPGAPEACDATTDNNCDGTTGTSCPQDTVCYKSVCDTTCTGTETSSCPKGTACTDTPVGKLCTPVDCGCAPGQVCVNNQCVDACQGVVCPGSLVCQDGNCVDPCAHLQCPAGQTCHAGVCSPPCNCYAGSLGCPDMNTVCDTGNTNTCVSPSCQNVMCPAGQTCDPGTGMCVGFCNNNVMCPVGQKCQDPGGCVPLCTGVPCDAPLTCDPTSGQCVDKSCNGVTCFPPQTCMGGVCVTPDGGGGDAGSDAGGTGGMGGSSASGGAGGAGGAPSPGAQGKCGCETVGDGGGPLSAAAALALVGLAMAVVRRRRD